ncbi:suppressor of cytokine signaling 4 [Triplophysa rosa]|uniref:Suppressor of cytokine signaling 4 n=1 Tax=Triplophysa rosa TaxID=992332 RepID=A0A9W7WJV9_TRIRA|nr:suppressor of cytokine signaling 4 [Triplophysa rosa]KAI7804662.1 putative suppressor of cytokine signaling 4 [Triplophysa rosa]
MSDKKPKNPDARPKNLRSWSADSYIRSIKKRSRGSRHETVPRGDEGEGMDDQSTRSASCPRRRRERKCSCTIPGEPDSDSPCRKGLSRRSLRQKFQDAVGQCLPLRSHHHHHHHQSGSSRPFSVLLWSKRKIHVSELMEDKCPFSPKSELAQCWHLIKKHGTKPSPLNIAAEPKGPMLTSSPPTLISWDEVSSNGASSLDDWDPSFFNGDGQCCSHTDYILVPDLLQINNSSCYWGVLDRFEAEQLLEGQPEGTFLLRDSAQDEYLFSVSFRRYSRSLHARIEQNGKRFSFDGRDPCMYRDSSVTGLLKHYSDPSTCLFFEPLLSRPLPRNFPFSLQHMCRAVICSCTTYPGIDVLPLPQSLRHFLRQYHYRCNGACAI